MKLTFEDGYNQAYKDYEKNPDIERLFNDYAWSLKGFWFHNPKARPMYNFIDGVEEKNNDYKVIVTRYDKGYEKALNEIKATLCHQK